MQQKMHPQSALMPEALITLAHFAMSLYRIEPNSSGVLPTIAPPSAARRDLISAELNALRNSALSRAMISRDVLPGVSMPCVPPLESGNGFRNRWNLGRDTRKLHTAHPDCTYPPALHLRQTGDDIHHQHWRVSGHGIDERGGPHVYTGCA
jgi:hypothetical protein